MKDFLVFDNPSSCALKFLLSMTRLWSPAQLNMVKCRIELGQKARAVAGKNITWEYPQIQSDLEYSISFYPNLFKMKLRNKGAPIANQTKTSRLFQNLAILRSYFLKFVLMDPWIAIEMKSISHQETMIQIGPYMSGL